MDPVETSRTNDTRSGKHKQSVKNSIKTHTNNDIASEKNRRHKVCADIRRGSLERGRQTTMG